MHPPGRAVVDRARQLTCAVLPGYIPFEYRGTGQPRHGEGSIRMGWVAGVILPVRRGMPRGGGLQVLAEAGLWV